MDADDLYDALPTILVLVVGVALALLAWQAGALDVLTSWHDSLVCDHLSARDGYAGTGPTLPEYCR